LTQNKLFWLPLEALDERYTEMTRYLYNDAFSLFFNNNLVIVEGDTIYNNIRVNSSRSFLDAYGTSYYKATQIQKLAKLFAEGVIQNHDKIFIDDLQFPVEWIRYMEKMSDMNVKIYGVHHAGTAIKTDEINKIGKEFKLQERVWLDMVDKIFVGSEFFRKIVIEFYGLDESKVIKTGLPFSSDYIRQNVGSIQEPRRNIVIFNGRIHPEKQPHLFDKLKEEILKRRSDVEFIRTKDLSLTKKDYYHLLSTAKVMVSFALQENFGYGYREAASLGCIPICPNRLSYKEYLPKDLLYDNFGQCVDKVLYYLDHPYDVEHLFDTNSIDETAAFKIALEVNNG